LGPKYLGKLYPDFSQADIGSLGYIFCPINLLLQFFHASSKDFSDLVHSTADFGDFFPNLVDLELQVPEKDLRCVEGHHVFFPQELLAIAL
jgi:hypothetical protein